MDSLQNTAQNTAQNSGRGTATMADFRENSTELLKQLKITQQPIVLTVNGAPEAVLHDPVGYQRLLDLAAKADAHEGIRQGLEDIATGRTRPAREVFDEFRKERSIPR